MYKKWSKAGFLALPFCIINRHSGEETTPLSFKQLKRHHARANLLLPASWTQTQVQDAVRQHSKEIWSCKQNAAAPRCVHADVVASADDADPSFKGSTSLPIATETHREAVNLQTRKTNTFHTTHAGTSYLVCVCRYEACCPNLKGPTESLVTQGRGSTSLDTLLTPCRLTHAEVCVGFCLKQFFFYSTLSQYLLHAER